MNLYVIRHGETEWNHLKVMQGSIDIPLNEKGREQARKIQGKMIDKQFDIIICSPLSRAKETAKILNEPFNKDIVVDIRLSERNYGEFEGIKKADFNYDEFWDYNVNANYDKAENIKDFYNRVIALIQDLKIKYQDRTVLLSTHAGVCKIIKFYISNNTFDDGKLGPYLPDNSEIIEYTI